MFYVDCGDGLRLVGASPECLCKVEKSVVTNHAIAGTVRRGKNAQGRFILTPYCLPLHLPTDPIIFMLIEDEVLSATLLASLKDRAEHVMLVDLARNDVNRVCQPETVKVDSLMQVEKFSHVMHLTSQVSGVLRKGLTRSVSFSCLPPLLTSTSTKSRFVV
jgi:anthranilate synthase component 1